jgi:hypothetical protein
MVPVARSCRPVVTFASFFCLTFASASGALAQSPPVDLSDYRADSGVAVRRVGDRLTLEWPMEDEWGQLILDLAGGRPLVASLAIAAKDGRNFRCLLEGADPVCFLLIGSRQAPQGRPPEMSVFNEFFDSPANRPFNSYRSRLDVNRVRVASIGRSVTISIADLSVGAFTGELRIKVYGGARLVHVETVIHTNEDRRAILYDAGLALNSSGRLRFAWIDTEGKLDRAQPPPDTKDRHLAVRHRTLVAESDAGSIACFPPPHQYFFPRDMTDNLKTAWFGRDHRGLDQRFGFGIRQAEKGGGSYVPWFNAPPQSEQRLGVFYLLSGGKAEEALEQTLRLTRGDRFPRLPGYHTLSSHWHMAIADAALKRRKEATAPPIPDFVGMFKGLGVDIVHLAEFHGDGHPQDSGSLRLSELQTMFHECERLSDNDLLFLPGEEANSFLGNARPGKEAGHWLYLFPKPVYWTMSRGQGQPFVEQTPPFGPVYHVGIGNDMQDLLERERGLVWTAHPRIKGSSWTPDAYRNDRLFHSDNWLGAAWKAMPADLSHDQLGRRVLDLMDDMANWGESKYILGEVDVFKLDHTHELYGHMNVNYIRLEPDVLPRFSEGWRSVLDSLRLGQFFVSTGEVLIPEFHVNGKPSGSGVAVKPGEKIDIRVDLTWTFPLRAVELISGNGNKVFRERIDCSDTGPFDKRTMHFMPDLTGRTWVRLEAWDVANNGAFTQPVWLGPSVR